MYFHCFAQCKTLSFKCKHPSPERKFPFKPSLDLTFPYFNNQRQQSAWQNYLRKTNQFYCSGCISTSWVSLGKMWDGGSLWPINHMWEPSNSAELFGFLSAETSKRKQSVSNCDNEWNEFVFCWQKWQPDCFRQPSAQPSRGHDCLDKDGQPRRTVDRIKIVTQPSV